MSTNTTSPDEARIRDLMDDWSAALRAGDIDRMLTHYSSGIEFFDLAPPLRHRGLDAYRRKWEMCLQCFPGQIAYEVRDLEVKVSGEVAFAHFLNRISELKPGNEQMGAWVRVTLCFQRIQDAWLVVHEHVSVPFDMQTFQALMQLQPETA